MRIFTIAANKGGTGKTTTAATLASVCANHFTKVLVIDLDPQGNLSFAMQADTSRPGSYELLTGAQFEAVIQESPSYSIDIIPASWNLSTLKTEPGSARRLQRALEPIKESGRYDIVIIDTPPTAGELLYNALQTSTDMIIPLTAGDVFSLQALYQITNIAKEIQKTNAELNKFGFIATQYSNRSTINRQLLDTMIEKAAEINVCFLGSVPPTVSVKEAEALQEPLSVYAPKCKALEAYQDIWWKL